MVVLGVLHQHLEDAATLRGSRSVHVRAPHVKLHHLRRLDDRLAAHLDGLLVAGEHGAALAQAALEKPGAGEVFTAAVGAIERRDPAGLDQLLSVAQTLDSTQPGVISAFGWVSASSLRGITRVLLDSTNPFRRAVGLAACAMHRADPGPVLATCLQDADAALRARALRVAGELARVDLLPACRAALTDDDAACRFEAARSAALLGDRSGAPAALHNLALLPSDWRAAALALVLQLQTPTEAHALLRNLAQEPAGQRLLIRGIGIAGDPHYVPWLIQQMQDAQLTRIAGEAFSLITGLDLAYLDLDRKPPEDAAGGPNDDPMDANVALDEDDSLPWPDPEKIAAWWQRNSARFSSGARYFAGEPPALAHSMQVLKNGFQRQRSLAADYACLLQPGQARFNTAAPAWRQQRFLAGSGA